MTMTSSLIVGALPVSQFAPSFQKPPKGAPGAFVAIHTTAGASVPVIVTVTVWSEVAPCESLTVTV